MSNEQNNQGPDLSVTTTKVLAIGSFTEKALDTSKLFPVMGKEVPATVRLYLEGKIEHWFIKEDISGPVFIMNVNTTAEAHKLLEALPLGLAEMMTFQLIPIGPLSPLRLLLND